MEESNKHMRNSYKINQLKFSVNVIQEETTKIEAVCNKIIGAIQEASENMCMKAIN